MFIFLIKSVIQQMLVVSVIVAGGPGSSPETHPSVMEGESSRVQQEISLAQLVLAPALST